MGRLENAWGDWVLRYRWPIILLCLLLVLLAASGARKLSFTTNYRVFFSAENPQLLAFEKLEATYAKNDNVMFVLTPRDGDVFTRHTLAAVEDLTQRAWQIPFSLRVDSLSNFQHTEAKGDDLVVRDLVQGAEGYTDSQLERLRDIALHEPLLVGRIVSPRAHVTAVNVTIQLPGTNEAQEVPEVVAHARKLADEIRAAYPNLEVRLTGMVVMNNAFSEASKGDMKTLVPLSFLLMLIMIGVLMRDAQGRRRLSGAFLARWGLFYAVALVLVAGGLYLAREGLPMLAAIGADALPASLLRMAAVGAGIISLLGLFTRYFPATAGIFWVIILSIVAAMGLAGHIGYHITPPSASAPTIILTVAIANAVHVLVTLFHELRAGRSSEDAIRETLRLNLVPIFLTSLTTAIGFLSMNFSEVPPFQQLGNIVAMGVAVSFVLSVSFLPALISVIPLHVRIRDDGDRHIMARFADFVVRRRRQLLWGMTALVLLLVAFIPRNELNDVFVHYFDESVSFRQDADYTTANLTGLYVIDYSLESGQPGGISEPAFLADVKAFADWYRRQPETMHVNAITDIMQRLNRNMHGDDPAWYRLPERRELAAQYLLLYEMSLPYGLDLNNQINVDKSATRMTVSLQTLSTNELLALKQRAEDWLAANTHSFREAEGSGPSVMFAYIGSRNIVSMLEGTTLALIGISLILVVALRSVKIGLLSMVPNLVPAAMGFGLWGLLVGEVGLALSVVSSMTLGIVVDDTVHFISKYLRARRERGLAPSDAVRYAFNTVGRALVVTSVVLVVGFLILALSTFKLNAGMGLLSAIVISFALAADFLLLPVLLMKFDGEKDEDTPADTVTDPAAA